MRKQRKKKVTFAQAQYKPRQKTPPRVSQPHNLSVELSDESPLVLASEKEALDGQWNTMKKVRKLRKTKTAMPTAHTARPKPKPLKNIMSNNIMSLFV